MEGPFVLRERVHTEGRQGPAGDPQGDGPEDVRRPRLLPIRQIRPHDLVQGDELDRAASAQERRAAREPVRPPEQSAGPIRRVHLVAGECEVVDVEGGHVYRAMRRELRRVDEDPRAVAMGYLRDLPHRPYLAGHVRRARHGDEHLPPAQSPERMFEMREGLTGTLRDREIGDGPALPGEQVGVVLAREGHDMRPVGEAARQEIRGIRSVARDDHRVVGPGREEEA